MFKLILISLSVQFFGTVCIAQGIGPVELKMDRLPQEPIVLKASTDAVDEGLKGKVKMVVDERADFSQESVAASRQISHLMSFNEKGNLIRRDYYDYRGNPWRITQYGYIDGKRVSKSRVISYPYDAPPMAAAPSAMPVARDTRYEYSYEFDYVDGKMMEKRLLSNSGRLISRDVYSYTNDKVERLVYSSDGRVNQKYLMVLDKRGNIVEQTDFGMQNRDIYGDRKYKYRLEFDRLGNWIKKEASQVVWENGRSDLKPVYVLYRSITYF